MVVQVVKEGCWLVWWRVGGEKYKLDNRRFLASVEVSYWYFFFFKQKTAYEITR